MSNNLLEVLKNELIEAYKLYTNDKSEISKIAGYFNLSLPRNRINDLEVVSFDAQKPKVTIYDRRDEVTYTGQYDRYNSFLDICASGSLCTTNEKIYKSGDVVTAIHYYGESFPFHKKLTLKDDHYKLSFGMPISDEKSRKKELSISLLDEQTSEIYSKRKVIDLADHYILDQSCFGKTQYLRVNKNTYTLADNLIYVIESNAIDNLNNIGITGFGIQSIEPDIKTLNQYLPKDFQRDSLDQSIKSWIELVGTIQNEHFRLSIFKTDQEYLIFTEKEIRTNIKTLVVYDQGFKYPHQLPGPLSSHEIDYLISVLRRIIPDQDFAFLASEELKEFEERISSNESNLKYFSLEDPSMYINLPFERIANLVLNNKSSLFSEMIQSMNYHQKKSHDDTSKVLKK